jgi:hypothetical protein
LATINPSVSIAIKKLKYNIVSNYIEKKMSPEEILDELKKVKLYIKGAKISELERYISQNMFYIWNKDKKVWEKDKQLNLFKIPELEDHESWGKIIQNLTADNQLSLLKDMKEILTQFKGISKDITVITKQMTKTTLMIDNLISKLTLDEQTEKPNNNNVD